MLRPFALAVVLALPTQGDAAEITVFAASSLKDALDPIAVAWGAETGNSVVIVLQCTKMGGATIACCASHDLPRRTPEP